MKSLLASVFSLFLISSVVLAEQEYRPVYRNSSASRTLATDPTPQPDPAENKPWWSPESQQYALGYENGSGNFNVFAQNAMVFGIWVGPRLGLDIYLGYTKDADTYTTTSASSESSLNTTKTASTTYSGIKNQNYYTLGLGLKYVLYQNSWVQINFGGVAAVTLPSSATYSSGTITETFAVKTDPTNKSVVDTVGSIEAKTALAYHVGPKIGSEFYLKWFPHLSLGFATGLLASFGGNTATTTTTRNKIFTVVNGTEQTPSTDTTSVSVADRDLGMRAKTFGIGGTVFNLFGNFTIRYVW